MTNIAIVGATGAVGEEIIEVLNTKNIKIDTLKLFASPRSAGKIQNTPFGNITLEEFSLEACRNIDIVFLAVGGDFSKEYAHPLTKIGCTVIDNSSAFRYDESVPLVIPGINSHAIGDAKLIANPNCTTAILGMALYPIYKEFGIQKLIVSTYQATSGAGNPGMNELLAESKNYLNKNDVENTIFAHPIPFNLIPHIDAVQENNYTKEEMKVTWETHKIFEDDSFPISCTAVRIPTLRAHAENIVVETKKRVDVEKIKELLLLAPGVELRDDIKNNLYPMPLTASKKYDVEAGRIRKNPVFGENGLEFFVCGDQLLRGAALNAVEIAEVVIGK